MAPSFPSIMHISILDRYVNLPEGLLVVQFSLSSHGLGRSKFTYIARKQHEFGCRAFLENDDFFVVIVVRTIYETVKPQHHLGSEHEILGKCDLVVLQIQRIG